MGTSLIVFLLMMSLATAVHEYTHVVVAYQQGCTGKLEDIAIFTGLSAITCPGDGVKLDLIALSAPIVCFIFGLYLWWMRGSDSRLRLWSLLFWFYGTIPSLAFWTPGSDAAFALSKGTPLIPVALLFLLLTGIVAFLVMRERTERGEPSSVSQYREYFSPIQRNFL